MEETQEKDLQKIYEIIKSHIYDNFNDMNKCKVYFQCLYILEEYNENLRSISI